MLGLILQVNLRLRFHTQEARSTELVTLAFTVLQTALNLFANRGCFLSRMAPAPAVVTHPRLILEIMILPFLLVSFSFVKVLFVQVFVKLYIPTSDALHKRLHKLTLTLARTKNSTDATVITWVSFVWGLFSCTGRVQLVNLFSLAELIRATGLILFAVSRATKVLHRNTAKLFWVLWLHLGFLSVDVVLVLIDPHFTLLRRRGVEILNTEWPIVKIITTCSNKFSLLLMSYSRIVSILALIFGSKVTSTSHDHFVFSMTVLDERRHSIPTIIWVWIRACKEERLWCHSIACISSVSILVDDVTSIWPICSWRALSAWFGLFIEWKRSEITLRILGPGSACTIRFKLLERIVRWGD